MARRTRENVSSSYSLPPLFTYLALSSALSTFLRTFQLDLTSYTDLSREFVENAVRFLVTRFMPLNPHDLESWSNDPEEWVNAEDKENEQWEFEIRVSGERICAHKMR